MNHWTATCGETRPRGSAGGRTEKDPRLRAPRRAAYPVVFTLNADGTTTAVSPDGTKTLNSHPPPVKVV
jgi:hypothetical protein